MQHTNALSLGKSSKKSIVLMLFSAAVYLFFIIFGLVKTFSPSYPISKAKLVLIQGILGFIFSFFPIYLKRLFKLNVSFLIQLVTTFFMYSSLALGEVFGFYYLYPYWDSMLHLFSGFGIAFAAFCLVNIIISESGLKNKFLFCIIGSITISLTIGLLWEILEFSVDYLFSTNMQKIIPQQFFNGGYTDLNLVGELDEIAKFYLTPYGYRYALMDTMKDIVLCLLGTLIFCILALATKKSTIYSTSLVRIKAPKKHNLITDLEPVFLNEESADNQIKQN